jgi:hypothetical protein
MVINRNYAKIGFVRFVRILGTTDWEVANKGDLCLDAADLDRLDQQGLRKCPVLREALISKMRTEEIQNKNALL